MERVQFQQEQMLAELKDLIEKGLFSKKEIKVIVKKRTEFETALIRRVPKKTDFLRYVDYEMGLERLRRKRFERLKAQSAPGPSTISDYALVRRQFQIFERALKKFGSDVALWLQYMQVTRREGARALVGRISARALQMHPNVPALYILAASHEIEHGSFAGARALLQRGLRLNDTSVEMWVEYVKMEIAFVESMRRRWDVLGIEAGKGKEKGKEKESSDITNVEDVDEDEGDIARAEIMDGAIIKSVISSAVKALPNKELFTSLHTLLTSHPAPSELRTPLLSHLHALLSAACPDDPWAVLLHATRRLTPELEEDRNSEEFIEVLHAANEELLQTVRSRAQRESRSESATRLEFLFRAYTEFVETWFARQNVDVNMRLYLLGSLETLARSYSKDSAALASAHVRLLLSPMHPSRPDPAKIVRLARRYTAKTPQSVAVWLARLEAEKRFTSIEAAEHAWDEARVAAAGEVDLWTWGLDALYCDRSLELRCEIHERLLKESMRLGSDGGVHEKLLIRYAGLVHEGMADRSQFGSEIEKIRRIAGRFHATGIVWSTLFSKLEESYNEDGERVLKEVYEIWRQVDGVEAIVAWGGWLIGKGKGEEAKEEFIRARRAIQDGKLEILEKRWREVLLQ